MLNSLKIGVRLGIGFAITLALLVIIAVLGINRISALNAEVTDVVKDKHPKTVYASNLIESVAVTARHLRNAYIYSSFLTAQSFSSRLRASTAYSWPIRSSAWAAFCGSASCASKKGRRVCVQHCACVTPVLFA